MSDACDCPPEVGASTPGVSPSATTKDCPGCGGKTKPVDLQTVKAMLVVPLSTIRSHEYRFCPNPTCDTVYSGDTGDRYQEEALRVAVHQKHPEKEDVFACYCFQHTPGSIGAELRESGTSTVVATISAGVKAGQCACEIRNPQGSCCLGNVRAVIQRLKTDLAQGGSPA